MKILLVEDSALVLEYMETCLSDEGHDVVVADTAKEALKQMALSPAARLLITDFNLEDRLDGVDLADRFKAINPSARVVIISGDSIRVREKLGSRPAGFATFLAKPFVESQLLLAIDRATKHVVN